MKELDENKKNIITWDKRKECNTRNSVVGQERTVLSKGKENGSLIKRTRQLILLQKNVIATYRLSNGKNPNVITKILEAKLVDFVIDRARYHCGDLEGNSIVRLFQNTNKIFK